jgi:CHAD domain-containing protein
MARANGTTQMDPQQDPPAKKKAQPRSKLIKYVDQLAEELRVSLGHAFEGDVDAIHEARVATRRLKAVMDLFDEHLSKRLKDRFSKSLKRIRRMLGRVRDLDVMIEHVQAAKNIEDETSEFLLGCLKSEREDELQQMSELNAAKMLGKLGSWWGLREQIQDELALSLLRQSLHIRLEQFCHQADLHSGVKAASSEASGITALNPHELRIFGKALRYTVEMAIEEGLEITAPVLRTFKRMQDLLGLWHDHVVLTGKVLEICVDENLSYTNPALLKKSLSFAQTSARRSERRLKDFFALWKKQGETLHAQITETLGEFPTPEDEIIEAEAQLEETAST